MMRWPSIFGDRDTDASSGGLRPGFWHGVGLRAVLPYVLFGVLVVLAIAVMGREIEHRVEALESWISGLGPWGAVVFVFLFVVLTSLLVPDTALAIVAGALFGLVRGVGLVAFGGVAAAVLQYVLARTLLRRRIDRFLVSRPGLGAIQRAVMAEQARLQFLVRLTPLSPALTSYVLGAEGVRFSGFLAALVSLLPAFFLEVYFGYAGKHLARMAGRPATTVELHDMLVLGGVAISVVVMTLVARTARRSLDEATEVAGAGAEV